MGDPKHVSKFNSKAHEDTLAAMRARREEVHARGEEIFAATGKLDKNVDINGKLRVSRNSMIKHDEKVTLPNGIALPIIAMFDGTGSMGGNVAKAFVAIPVIDTMLGNIKHRYNPQIASGVVQDVVDSHPVVQLSQFESDNRIAEQIRLLVPDKAGADDPEDYDLALAYIMLATDTDIFNMYGLKGYLFMVGDQIGRGQVNRRDVQRYLGHSLQSESMSTREICRTLEERWHTFYIQVGSDTGGRRDATTTWWEQRMGRNHVVIVPDADMLAETQAGLIYITETLNPTREGLIQFVTSNGSNKRITPAQAGEVWNWINEAGVPHGAQAKLAGYNQIPLPGAVFEHYRHAWPEGHEKAPDQKVFETTDPTKPSDDDSDKPAAPKSFDWSRW